MRILICKVPSAHVRAEGGERGRSPAGCSQSPVRRYKHSRGAEARAGAGKGHDAAGPGRGLASHSPCSQPG